MPQTSTQDLLLLYAYGETTPEQQARLAMEMAKDPSLREQLDEIIATQKMLNAKRLSPSSTSLDLIMKHSHESEQLQEI